jgi:hypothetical protein
MRSLRQSGIRYAGALLLAVLLFVPLVESAHSHANRDLARPCATCVVAHHSPASVAPSIAVAPTTIAAGSTIIASSFAPAQLGHSPRRGRAPPTPSFSVSL